MRLVHIVVSWLALICYIVLLSLVLYKKRGEDRLGRRFVLYLLNMMGLQIVYLFISLSTDLNQANVLYLLLIPLATGQPIIYYLFTRAFLKRSRSNSIIGLSVVTWMSIAVLSISPLQHAIYLSIHQDKNTGLLVPEFGPLVLLLAVPTFTFWGLSITNLFKEIRATDAYVHRIRAQYLLLGTAITLIGISVNFLPALKPYPVDVIANLLNALLIAHAILRYQLLDITILVRQGILQIIPISIMIVTYFLIIYITTRFFDVLAGPQILFIAVVVAFIGMVIASPFHNMAQRWLEKALFREKYDSTMMIQKLSQISTTMLDLEALTSTILDNITRVLHIQWAAFFLDPDDKGYLQLIAQRGLTADLPHLRFKVSQTLPQDLSNFEKAPQPLETDNLIEATQGLRTLKEWGAKHLIPLKARGELIGVLIIGPKWGNRPYTQEDELTLTTLANQTGVALDNARLHQQSLAYAEQLEQRVQARTNELQAQYAQLNAILQNSTNGIVVVDEEGHIIQANPMTRLWLNQALDEEDTAHLKRAIQNLAQKVIADTPTEEAPTIILELKNIDLTLNAAPVTNMEAPEVSSAVINIHDVSHLKALERMRTSFVTHISHELRTPITAIKLYTHLIQKYPARLATYLPLLIQQTDHQAQLVQDIVAIARLDAGQTTLHLERKNLDDLVHKVVDTYQTTAHERGLTLKHQRSPTALKVVVDVAYVSQALENVLKNALTYTPEGGSVTVSVTDQTLEGKPWATIVVTDTGIGIPEDESPHVFDRFFKGKHPRAMQLAGTGLGLAVAQAVAQQHGGHMTVKSKEDVGSTFTMWLPIVA